jgi:hypothetical protein
MSSDLDKFIKVVVDSSATRGIKWDDIVMRFEWIMEEEVKINEYLNTNPSNQ